MKKKKNSFVNILVREKKRENSFVNILVRAVITTESGSCRALVIGGNRGGQTYPNMRHIGEKTTGAKKLKMFN